MECKWSKIVSGLILEQLHRIGLLGVFKVEGECLYM